MCPSLLGHYLLDVVTEVVGVEQLFSCASGECAKGASLSGGVSSLRLVRPCVQLLEVVWDPCNKGNLRLQILDAIPPPRSTTTATATDELSFIKT